MSEIYLNNMRYPMQQINGQRITGPCAELQGDFEPLGFEIWVNNIPRDMYEETLLPLFSRMGVIYQFRLMMNFSGQNRGFAYLQYAYQADAERALLHFNAFEVRAGCRLRLLRSFNLRRLVLGGIRMDVHPDAICAGVNTMASDVLSVQVLVYGQLQYAILQFPSHWAAAMGRRSIVQDIRKFGPGSWINWDN